MTATKTSLLCLVSLVIVSSITHADDGRSRHQRIFVVPTPAGSNVKVDGDLSDWDLSGQIWIYVTPDTAEMQSARFALMYDKEALYVSAVIRDPSPMINRHDPKVDPDWGWDADCCQFRIVVDASQGWPVQQGLGANAPPNEQMLHMTLWNYTDRKEPVVHLVTGMGYVAPPGYKDGIVPSDKFQAVYKEAEDGRGYTMEYRLPWSTLRIKNLPKPGDLVASTVQFNWGRPDGLRTAGGASWAYDVMCRPGFTFQESGCWGKAVFAEKGNLPREMVEEGAPPEAPLPLTFDYEAPEDAEVTVTLFNERGDMVRNLVSSAPRRAGKNVERWDGLDDRGNILPAGHYTWKGLYHQPITTKFLLSVHNTGTPPYKTDDGTGGWGGDHGWPQDIAMLGDKQVLICWNAAEAGWGLIGTDLKGKKLKGTVSNSELVATSDDGKLVYTAATEAVNDGHLIRILDASDFRPVNFGYGKPVVQAPPGTPARVHFRGFIGGLDCVGDTLYASVPSLDMIVLYDAMQGTVKTTWKVPKPGHLVVRKDGAVLVVSGKEVLAVKDNNSTPLIRDHLEEPAGIALDAEGNIFVANRGALHNISVFDSGGKYLRSIGKVGGRPWKGKFEQDGMLMPRGLEVDPEGKLWVAEELDYPKRVSVWDSKTGKLMKEFFGGSCYATWVSMVPGRDDRAYCHDVEWEIDLKNNTSRPLATLWREDRNNPNMVTPISESGNSGHLRIVKAKNGKEFAVGQGRDYGQRVMIRDGEVFKPFIATINNVFENPYIPWPLYPAIADKQRFKEGVYLWQDQNDDQCVQADEFSLIPEGTYPLAWFDENCTIWNGRAGGGSYTRPVRYTDGGRPVYDFSKQELNPFYGHVGNMTGVWTNLENPSDTRVYVLRAEGDRKATDPLKAQGMSAFTRDGKLLWNFQAVIDWHSAMNLGVAKAGKIWGPTSPLGVAGPFTGVATYFGSFHILRAEDGLYVAKIMKDGRLPGLGADVIAAECFMGQMVRTKDNRYLLLGGDQDGRITEILGLDTVEPLAGGSFTHQEKDVKIAREAQDGYQRQLAKAQTLTIDRGAKAISNESGVTKRLEDGRGFTARLAYDAENLYIRYEIEASTPFINATPDPQIVFKGGNVVDVQLATNSGAPADREKPAPGDVRILLAKQVNRDLAVIYRPKVANFAGQPNVLKSPSGEEPFDQIEVLENVGLQVAPSPTGFTVSAAIPLAKLNWSPQPGSSLKADVGYIFGNAAGTQAASRAYWSNNSFTANVVNDVPHESRLEPKEWGTAAVE